MLDYLPMKESVSEVNLVKTYYDKALEISAEDHQLNFVYGQLLMSFASVPWAIRKTASLLGHGKIPEATYPRQDSMKQIEITQQI
jgi:hypothetical protein